MTLLSPDARGRVARANISTRTWVGLPLALAAVVLCGAKGGGCQNEKPAPSGQAPATAAPAPSAAKAPNCYSKISSDTEWLFKDNKAAAKRYLAALTRFVGTSISTGNPQESGPNLTLVTLCPGSGNLEAAVQAMEGVMPDHSERTRTIVACAPYATNIGSIHTNNGGGIKEEYAKAMDGKPNSAAPLCESAAANASDTKALTIPLPPNHSGFTLSSYLAPSNTEGTTTYSYADGQWSVRPPMQEAAPGDARQPDMLASLGNLPLAVTTGA